MATRTRRTKEEIIKDLDSKIAYHKTIIEQLEAKKEKTLNPPKRKTSSASIIKKAKEKGLTEEKIAELLGIEL